MTSFLTDLRDAVRFDDIVKTINTLISDYMMESLGVLLAVLFILLCLRLLKTRKQRRLTRSKETHGQEARESTEAYPGQESVHMEETVRRTGTPSAVDEADTMPPEAPPKGLMDRLKSGLHKTRTSLTGRIENIISESGVSASDHETLEKIEEALITSDVGVDTTMALIEKIKENGAALNGANDMREFLKSQMRGFLTRPMKMDMSVTPYVIMVVGVNGVGKTTTIGKLAYKYRAEGYNVLIGAADTFRAAAVEQLQIWSERAGADIVRHRENADPAAVAFDAVEAGLSRGSDIVIIDTAGRLQTKVNLMEQLKKIKRSIAKKMPDAPHAVMLVLDATTGQNAISQARLFHEGIGVTSLVLTKLDGTAKGGIVIGICSTMKLPLQYIGVGEGINDLQPFDPEKFTEALF